MFLRIKELINSDVEIKNKGGIFCYYCNDEDEPVENFCFYFDVKDIDTVYQKASELWQSTLDNHKESLYKFEIWYNGELIKEIKSTNVK